MRVLGNVSRSKSVKNEVIDKSVTTVAKPGVRYWFTEKGGSKQSFISEVGALFISFFFAGIVPLLIILFFIGWLSRRARSRITRLHEL